MKRNSVLGIEGLLIVIVIQLFLFQSILQEYVSVFRYFDEAITVVLALLAIYKIGISKIKLDKHLRKMIIIMIMLVFIGIISNYTAKVQLSYRAIFQDILLFTKFFIVVVSSTFLFSKPKKYGAVFRVNRNLILFYSVISFIFMIVNAVTNSLDMTYEMRFGLKSFEFIYGHPGTFQMILISYLFLIYSDCVVNKRKNLLLIVLVSILLISTLRTKAITVAIISVAIYYFLILKKYELTGPRVTLLLILILILGSGQLAFYFFSDGEAPRKVFWIYGVKLANQGFPFGYGFGTFGSYTAQEFYSPLYYEFGFDRMYGMGPDNPLFLNDNYFPMILGQLGYIGLILTVLLIYNLFKYLLNKNSKKGRTLTYLLIIVMSISSIVDSSFNHPLSLGIGFIYGVSSQMINSDDRMELVHKELLTNRLKELKA